MTVNIAPHIVVAGDTWTIPVLFLNPDGTPRAIGSTETPGAELYVADVNATYNLTADLQVTNASLGQAAVVVPILITSGILPQTPTDWADQGYPVRLHAFITDSRGDKTTFAVTPLEAVDWRTFDLTQLPAPGSVSGVVGPAGAAGAPGAAASLAQVLPYILAFR